MAEPRRISNALLRWSGVLVPGAVLYFTPFGGFDAPQRHLLAIFVATVIGLAL